MRRESHPIIAVFIRGRDVELRASRRAFDGVIRRVVAGLLLVVGGGLVEPIIVPMLHDDAGGHLPARLSSETRHEATRAER
jgi:hypothetical protein